MELLNNYNHLTKDASEDMMQFEVDQFLRSNKYREIDKYGWRKNVNPIILRELNIPEVHRRSDNIIYLPYTFTKPKIVNIECKLDSISCVISQAKDHLRWCDYSIICLPPDRGYVANYHKQEIINSGLGLFYWFRGIGLFEFILPKYNRKKDDEIRKRVIERILERESLKLAI